MAKNKNRKRNATPLIKEKVSKEPERVESSEEEDDDVSRRIEIFGI